MKKDYESIPLRSISVKLDSDVEGVEESLPSILGNWAKTISKSILAYSVFTGLVVGFSFGYIWASQQKQCGRDETIGDKLRLGLDSMVLLDRLPHEAPMLQQMWTEDAGLTYMNHDSAYSLLQDSINAHYFLYNSGLDVQINQAYCGVASAASLLNSLRFLYSFQDHLPQDQVYQPYAYATQIDVFNECTAQNVILRPEYIMAPPFGLALAQVEKLLECFLPHGRAWNIKAKYVDPQTTSPEQVRSDLISALSEKNSRVIINFDRAALGQVGGGHFSPLGAYNKETDSFLILDVAKYKYPPVFVPFTKLYESMSTFDSCGMHDFPQSQSKLSTIEWTLGDYENQWDELKQVLGCQQMHRGYIIVRKRSGKHQHGKNQ